ncbi:helix-turn-helix transcriptional regulator [Roseibium sp. RKSG952]|uniref:helix-turn-helix transcriptional regulator n=1 Tax=Roseibium sp. RKSG952 TaxID=2529384 RepID=UPI0012BBA78C|nr:LuxR C-terminal-related transcriptional regulator [Roseibium sp. RKSG952]MTH99600.1 LuxR family transcriptional regulator [Roseibium sp. RKSG952]
MKDRETWQSEFVAELFANLTKRDAFVGALSNFTSNWRDVIFGWQVMQVGVNEWSFAKPFNCDDAFYRDFFEVAHLHPFPPQVKPSDWHNDMVSSEAVLAPEELAHTEFFDHAFRSRGNCDRIHALRVYEKGPNVAALAAHLPRQLGERETSELWQALAFIKPFMQSAYRLSLELQERQARARPTEQFWLDRLPTPAFVLDRNHRVLMMNREAAAFFQTSEVLALDPRSVVLPRGKGNAKVWQSAVAGAFGSARISGPNYLRTATGPPIGLFAQSMSQEPEHPYSIDPFRQDYQEVLVHVLDPAQVPRGSSSALEGAFDISRSEARLLLELVSGLSLREAAGKLGISYHTARNQRANMLSKSGLRSQTSLVCRATSTLLKSPLPE